MRQLEPLKHWRISLILSTKACQIAEGGGYMRDYVEDEKGRIARVDFDFVKEK